MLLQRPVSKALQPKCTRQDVEGFCVINVMIAPQSDNIARAVVMANLTTNAIAASRGEMIYGHCVRLLLAEGLDREHRPGRSRPVPGFCISDSSEQSLDAPGRD